MIEQETKKRACCKAKEKKEKKQKWPKASIRWTAAAPIIHQDQIISSVAREKNIFGFKPSYEDEPFINMHYILGDEYARMWFKEREAFNKEHYTSEQVIELVETSFTRRHVQRIMAYKRPTKASWLERRVRDWNKLTKDEAFTIRMQETKYKVDECFNEKKKPKKKEELDTGAKECICK